MNILLYKYIYFYANAYKYILMVLQERKVDYSIAGYAKWDSNLK